MFGTLEYGSVQLSINRMLSYEVRPVSTSDNANYLYSHVKFRLELILNPIVNATLPNNSTVLSTDPGGAGAGSDGGPVHFMNQPQNFNGPLGSYAPKTFANLQHALSQKRMPLRIYIGPPPTPQNPNSQFLFLQSPELVKSSVTNQYVPAASDAFTGPNPRVLGYSVPMGYKTALVIWECETWINQCKTAHFVLANQFSASEEFDADNNYLSTITYAGEATFHMGRLLSGVATGALTADQFRQVFFFPVPPGFQRTNVRVSPSSDGSVLRYSFQDEQQTFAIVAQHIARIRGHFGASVTGIVSDDWLRGAISDPLGGLLDVGNAVRCPIQNLLYEIELWGTPYASQVYLLSQCVACAVAGGVNFITSNTVWDISARFPERYASLRAVTRGNGIIGGISAGVQGAVTLGNLLSHGGDIASPLWVAGGGERNTVVQPSAEREAFSSVYAEMLSQALAKPCAAPTYPKGTYPNKSPLPFHYGDVGGYGSADMDSA